MTVDRCKRSPTFLVCPWVGPDREWLKTRSIPFCYHVGPTPATFTKVLEQLRPSTMGPLTKAAVTSLLEALWTLFRTYEGVSLSTYVAPSAEGDRLLVYNPSLTFDDAAFRSCGRHAELHAQRDTSPAAIDPHELAAEVPGEQPGPGPPENRADSGEAPQHGTMLEAI
jgi:succinyl-CoA synthetase alpha subunit